jgi:2,3-bisphosphoglycerate-independent phosphoglycerate mutase
MKYVVIVPDGMADHPLERLGGRTPLEAAATPHMDRVARSGRLGMAVHTPRSLPPGSDVAMLSLLGYDPTRCYTGRAPLEAASMGIELRPDQVAVRCNLVTVDGDIMADHSAGRISTEEARVLVDLLQERLGSDSIRFYPGVGYRHLVIWDDPGIAKAVCTPPHDILGMPWTKHLPRGRRGKPLVDLIRRSADVLAETDINDVRIDLGENPANLIWLWGGGTRPELEPFAERYGPRGAVVAAVDLVRGIGRSLGLDIIDVEGATGYVHTNFVGKGKAAIDALHDYDFVFVHIEAPDEAGHEGDIQAKVDTIEAIDTHIVGPVLDVLEARGDGRLLVLPDHPTPIDLRTHVHEAVPFAWCGPGAGEPSGRDYTEKTASETGLMMRRGHELMGTFLGDEA